MALRLLYTRLCPKGEEKSTQIITFEWILSENGTYGRERGMSMIQFKQIAFIACNVFLFLTIIRCNSRVSFPDDVEAKLPEKIDFNYHIKPILSDRCFACHGPDQNKREAGLRLDIADSARAALGEDKDHYAIVPGKAHKSALVERIMSTDPEVMMPPPESNLKLSEPEIALLTRWIEQGAEYKPHWSFIKPGKPDVPATDFKNWAENELDHFILSKMMENGLEPSQQATKETLIRRLSFDLTGLPPTVEEVDAFIADSSSTAYQKLVSRLLESPHYGERMASEWLDVARYADSHGYQDDGMRNMWPWRDWVIKSFNQNMPYDKFILWQIAGDMLPDASKEQILATAFNRNHLQSQEGGIVPEEYRVEYVADRTNTFGKAFLALSTECARCHDHKFDPVSQKEYYQLYAFFNNNNESGMAPFNTEAPPTVILSTEETESLLKYIHEKIDPIEESMEAKYYRKSFESWLSKAEKTPEQFTRNNSGLVGLFHFDEAQEEKEFKNAVNTTLKSKVAGDPDRAPLPVPGKFGNARKLIGDAGIGFSKELDFDRHQQFSISIWVNVLKEGEEGTLFAKCNGEFTGYRGYRVLLNKNNSLSVSFSYAWPANCIDLKIPDRLTTNQWHHVVLTYDGSSKASGVKLFLDGRETQAKVITDNLQKSILYGTDKKNWTYSSFMIGKDIRGTIKDVLVDELVAYQRQLSALEVREINGQQGAIAALLKTHSSGRAPSQQDELFEYYLLNYDREYASQLSKITRLRDEENQLLTVQPEVMVMQERSEPRPTFILDRGAYDAPTQKVDHGTPAAVMSFPDELPKNRLGLARWLIHEDNPLTARVAVNRYWQMLFGKGIVKTSDDFGNQGALPTHPELLDWLAVKFRDSGWNVKALLNLIVTSATYRQSSVLDKKLLEQDPDNTWLARGPSYRMPAEMIRDNALAASGLLFREIGGRSVKPYQPKGLWEELAIRNATVYEPDTGKNLYRRGLYTIWKRSSPPPAMIIFDASDKYVCSVKRQSTNTPLQALVLLNDPQYVEAARVLAEKMITRGGEGVDRQISYGFKAMTSRDPHARELNLLKELYEAQLVKYQNDPVGADRLLHVGEQPVNPALPKNKVAALTLVASTLINYDEAVFKR